MREEVSGEIAGLLRCIVTPSMTHLDAATPASRGRKGLRMNRREVQKVIREATELESRMLEVRNRLSQYSDILFSYPPGFVPQLRGTVVEQRTSAIDSNPDAIPALSLRQYDILEALHLLRATDPEKRCTTSEVARKVDGPQADPESFKDPIADLKRRKLLHTKEGRGGGCWLSREGSMLIRQVRNLETVATVS